MLPPSGPGGQSVEPKRLNVESLRSKGVHFARCWTCLVPVALPFFHISPFGGGPISSMPVPPLYFWKCITCLALQVHSWRETLLKDESYIPWVSPMRDLDYIWILWTLNLMLEWFKYHSIHLLDFHHSMKMIFFSPSFWVLENIFHIYNLSSENCIIWSLDVWFYSLLFLWILLNGLF